MRKKADDDWMLSILKKNPYDITFSTPSMRRMVRNSLKILPFLEKYKNYLGDNILEVGPFYDPLIIPEQFPDKTIFYIEHDRHAFKWLKKKKWPVYLIRHDLNKLDGASHNYFKTKIARAFDKSRSNGRKFSSVIVSQVFNYIDYKKFIFRIRPFIKRGGVMFVNNIINYGLWFLFSEKRPTSISQTIRTFEDCGYKIMEKRMFRSTNKRFQASNQMILVVKKA